MKDVEFESFIRLSVSPAPAERPAIHGIAVDGNSSENMVACTPCSKPTKPAKITVRRSTLVVAICFTGMAFTNGLAMAADFLIAEITGTSPQMVPILHLPTRYLEAGDTLVRGDEFLMLKGATVVLVELETNIVYSVKGPNRVGIEREGVQAYNRKGLIRHQPAFFHDPRSAVDQIGRMLRDRAWLKLAMYYDLSSTEVDPATLISGAFFLRAEAPKVGHPAVDNRIKEPFSPQFSYRSHRSTAGDEIVVIVSFSVDEGMGMVREGLDAFPMRKVKNGYRLLPKRESDSPFSEMPVPDPGSGPSPLP